MAMRKEFPPINSDYMGGESDGYEYRTVFAGSNLDQSYEMIRLFLIEEGYKDVPLPKDGKDLSLFRLSTRNKQILMFLREIDHHV